MTPDPHQFCRLLIRAPNWLGDSVLALPAVDALRHALPEAHIAVMARQAVADLWRMAPVDQVIPFNFRRGFAGLSDRMAYARMLRGEGFDSALIMPNSFDSALVPMLAGIPERVGWATDCRFLLLTRRIRRPAHLDATSQSRVYASLVTQWLGRHLDVHDDARLRVPDDAQRRVCDARTALPPLVLGINPGATYGAAKCWLPERYADVAVRAHEKCSAQIVLFGGPGDAAVCAAVQARIARHTTTETPWCINLAGATTLAELAAWLQECTCLVTNDTGTMHLAALLGVRTVAIFGSTEPTLTGPLGSGSVVLRRQVECSPCFLRECPIDFRCMKAVESADVIAAVRSIVGGTLPGTSDHPSQKAAPAERADVLK